MVFSACCFLNLLMSLLNEFSNAFFSSSSFVHCLFDFIYEVLSFQCVPFLKHSLFLQTAFILYIYIYFLCSMWCDSLSFPLITNFVAFHKTLANLPLLFIQSLNYTYFLHVLLFKILRVLRVCFYFYCVDAELKKRWGVLKVLTLTFFRNLWTSRSIVSNKLAIELLVI